MADGTNTAVIAGSVTLCVAYLNSFLAESYRRHRDGSALAAGLLGELSSYETAWPLIDNMMDSVILAIDEGERSQICFRMIDRPKDRFFDDVVGKIGILGADLLEGIVYIYGNIGAFRMALEVISREYKEMDDVELRQRCVACKASVERAIKRGDSLMPALRARAARRFIWRG